MDEKAELQFDSYFLCQTERWSNHHESKAAWRKLTPRGLCLDRKGLLVWLLWRTSLDPTRESWWDSGTQLHPEVRDGHIKVHISTGVTVNSKWKWDLMVICRVALGHLERAPQDSELPIWMARTWAGGCLPKYFSKGLGQKQSSQAWNQSLIEDPTSKAVA